VDHVDPWCDFAAAVGSNGLRAWWNDHSLIIKFYKTKKGPPIGEPFFNLTYRTARVPAVAGDLGYVAALGVLAMLAAILGVVAHGTHASRMSASVVVICHLLSPLYVDFAAALRSSAILGQSQPAAIFKV
jgi:hypothetical protein